MKQLLVLFMLLCSTSLYAQDVIVKKDGSTVACRVIEVNSSEIVYKKWSNQSGPNYVMERSVVSAINYQNGKIERFSTVNNQYKPGNQSNGSQQYNDRALLRMDAQSAGSSKMKRNGWFSCGIAGAGLAFMAIISAVNQPDDYGYRGDMYDVAMAGGGILTAAGIVGAILCFNKAHKLNKESSLQVDCSPLFQKDYVLPNKSTLSIGSDLLSDRISGTKAFGFGLRYNF